MQTASNTPPGHVRLAGRLSCGISVCERRGGGPELPLCGTQGTMVAGWDLNGPGLYYVDSDGQRTKGKIFSVGSGSLYAYGVLDQGYKWFVLCCLLSVCHHYAIVRRRLRVRRGSGGCGGCRDMSVEDACELGRRAIYHATFRDAVSGGTVSGE